MRLIQLSITLAVVLVCAMPAAKDLAAAPAVAIPLQGDALGRDVSTAAQAGVTEAGVRIYIGPPYGYYRRHYYYRPYYYRRRYYRPYYHRKRYRGRCGYWGRQCAKNWGYGNSNYYGCLRYHGCR